VPLVDERYFARQSAFCQGRIPDRFASFCYDIPAKLADDLARRALRAAIFGAMSIFFLLNFYSLWLSLRLCLMPGELTPENGRRLRWAMLLNGFVVVVWVVGFEIWRWMF
jgi:hypothetical protein